MIYVYLVFTLGENFPREINLRHIESKPSKILHKMKKKKRLA